MSRQQRYLLDANTFIDGKNRHYAFDICPGYWTALLRLNEKRVIYSIVQVKDELVGLGDELSDWVNDAPNSFFKKTDDEAVVKQYAAIVRWLQAQDQYTEDAKARFLDGADPWLIAYAKVNNHFVVTYETHEPDARARVKIPNVCIRFNVDWCDPFEMMRQTGVRLRSAPIK